MRKGYKAFISRPKITAVPTKKLPIVTEIRGKYIEVVIEDVYQDDRIFTVIARLDLVNNKVTLSKPHLMGGTDRSYTFVNSDPSTIRAFSRCALKALEMLERETSK